MAYQWMIGFKQSNERKTVLLMVLFPILLFAVVLIVMTLFFTNSAYDMTLRFQAWIRMTGEIFIVLLPVIVIRGLITFFFQKQIMFSFSGAKEVSRKENPEIYNIVENLCISRGLPVAKIWIIPTPWCNAFATGRRTKDSRIVFTQGLLDTLEKGEIEAVAAHELTHIINKDSMLMLVTVIFIGVISIIGEVLVRSRSRGSKNGAFILVGVGFIVLGYLIYPLLRLAISRKREFLADAGSIELIKDNQAMISALQKISGHSTVPSARQQIAMFFFANPNTSVKDFSLSNGKVEYAHQGKKSSIRDTHPSIDERIQALQHF